MRARKHVGQKKQQGKGAKDTEDNQTGGMRQPTEDELHVMAAASRFAMLVVRCIHQALEHFEFSKSAVAGPLATRSTLSRTLRTTDTGEPVLSTMLDAHVVRTQHEQLRTRCRQARQPCFSLQYRLLAGCAEHN